MKKLKPGDVVEFLHSTYFGWRPMIVESVFEDSDRIAVLSFKNDGSHESLIVKSLLVELVKIPDGS